MDDVLIPKYQFNSKKSQRGIELVPLQRILAHSKAQGHKAHRVDFFQLLFVRKGAGNHEVDFETISYSDFSVIPVARGQVQRFIPDCEMEGFALIFTTEFLIKEATDYRYLYDYLIFNHYMKPISVIGDEQLFCWLGDIEKEQANTLSFDNAEMLRHQLKNILIGVERLKRDKTEIVCNETFSIYLKFRRFLEDNVTYKLRVADVCDQLSYTPKQLNVAVNLFAKCTAKQFIEDRVVLEMKRLLVYSTLTVKEIAYELGFDDPTNFTKYFKARVNMLPSDYQKLL